MSEEEAQAAAASAVGEDEDEDLTPGYKAPKKVDLQTIKDLDPDDEALVKYKKELLGDTKDVLDEGGLNVVVQKMSICPTGQPDIELDLKDTSKLKDNPVTIKEGCTFSIKIQFRVQREIVSGLRYNQKCKKMGLKDKSNIMVGSYPPKTEPHVFQTKAEEAPSGMLLRGSFNVSSKFTDDDKNVYLEWDWVLKIVK